MKWSARFRMNYQAGGGYFPEEPAMSEGTLNGIVLVKHVFHLHAQDRGGRKSGARR